jgi:polysaccharide pyruvyl transferase WcaK-like protein
MIGIANYLNKIHLPMIVLGLGAQDHDSSLKNMSEKTEKYRDNEGFLRLVEVLDKKSLAIGVRGDFTRRLLRQFNVDSFVSGCPSLMLSENASLGEYVKNRWDKLLSKLTKGESLNLSITAASPWQTEKVLTAEKKLLSLFLNHDGLYIQQSGGESVLKIASKKYQHISNEMNFIKTYKRRLNLEMEEEAFSVLLDKKMMVFYDVDKWQRSIKDFDLSIGTRMHGNCVALQTGLPAITLTHDSRTEELCHAMRMPYVSTDRFAQLNTLSDLVKQLDFDEVDFDANRRNKARQYERVLRENGIEPSAHLLKLSYP